MTRLTAEFTIRLPSYVFTSFLEAHPFKIAFDDFDISVFLSGTEDGSWLPAAESTWMYPADQLRVTVSREEPVDPPEVIVVDRKKDYTEQAHYLQEREPGYQRVALIATNRFIRFFKYRLNNPHLREFSLPNDEFANPSWTDSMGRPVQGVRSLGTIDVGRIKLLKRLDARALTSSDESALEEVLRTGLTVETPEELQSDAQAAILDGSMRRAVLDMAVGCEVAVRQTYFRKSTAASAAYEFLEDKRRVNVTVQELISKVAEEAFGQSFKIAEPDDYNNIDLLFRCRNKVAHRADSVYRDDRNILHTLDAETASRWWASVQKLLTWLRQW